MKDMKQTPKSIYGDESQLLAGCLKRLRISARMTQSELASKLGYSQAYVSKYECGQMQLSVVDVRRICLELGSCLIGF